MGILDRAREILDGDDRDDAPYVCPGCYAIGGEPCAPDCIDAEIERDREEGRERDELYDDNGDELDDGARGAKP